MLYTVIDVETNGLSTQFSEVLEVGYIQINKKREVIRKGEIYFYRPEWTIRNAAFEVHGLTEEFLNEKCPDEETFCSNLVKLYTLMYKGIIIGKNSDKFDIPVITNFLRRYAKGVPSIVIMATLDLQTLYAPKYREYYKAMYGEVTRKSGKLEELVCMTGLLQEDIKKQFSLEMGEVQGQVKAHGALYDAYMTLLLLNYAVEHYGLDI
jgi:DNA polymerase III, epsilon subunit and related 3''-5'' exonucleases